MKLLRILVFFLYSTLTQAIDTHQFHNAQQQADYQSLITELRCLVCQNQTIGDSNAPLAADLREQIYQMLQTGKTKAEILQFMTERYGDFVLYKPPFNSVTSLLWLAPVLFLLTGIIVVFVIIRRKNQTTAIDEQKLAQARALLNKE